MMETWVQIIGKLQLKCKKPFIKELECDMSVSCVFYSIFIKQCLVTQIDKRGYYYIN